MSLLHTFCQINIQTHLFFSFILRLLLIIYGVYHDQYSSVPYTDVDYKVFTDAARNILEEKSPYERHTYRYSPLLAFLLIPNVVVHHAFGKVLFCIIDVGVGLLIRLLVIGNLNNLKIHTDKVSFKALFIKNESSNAEKNKTYCLRQRKRSKLNIIKKVKIDSVDNVNSILYDVADKCMLIWLYNPLTIAISTRGNCDSFPGFIVLYSLYFLEVDKRPFIAGLIHGLAIHFRIYPIIYSLAMFMFLSDFAHYSPKRNVKTDSETLETKKIVSPKENSNKSVIPVKKIERKTIFKLEYVLHLIPNKDQLSLITGTLLSLLTLTAVFYYVYGYQFLYETYIFHLTRIDFRHNFSLYFYLQYLTAWIRNIGLWQKVLMILPQIILLLVFSVRYGLNKFSLNFAILLNTIVFVIYNRVLTSQYFVWVMVILPLCVWQIKITRKRALIMLVIWLVAQAAWLLPAYLLEFQGENTFFFIWIQSVSFFCANIAILGRLIIHFMHEEESSFIN